MIPRKINTQAETLGPLKKKKSRPNMQDIKETMATFHCVTRIEITRFKRTPG